MIRNILFDLGGVIMDIDKNRCVKAFQDMGFAATGEFLGGYAQKGAFADLESGRIDAAVFRRIIRPHLPQGTTDLAIDRAFCEFLVGIPVRRLVALRDLRRQGLGVYMLSNTNPIMWNSKIGEEFGREGLRREDYFDGMVTSFEARVMKPAPEISITRPRNLVLPRTRHCSLTMARPMSVLPRPWAGMPHLCVPASNSMHCCAIWESANKTSESANIPLHAAY